MKKIIIIFVFFLFMLLILEIFAKILFPEFSSRSVEAYKDHAIIQGKKNFYKKLISRNKSEIYEISIRDKKFKDNNIKQDYYVAILGDSVSSGFGLAYQNIYYAVAENLLNKINIKTKIVSYANNGSDLRSELKQFKNFYKNEDLFRKKILVYQFSYNDLTPAYLYGFDKGHEYFGPKETSEFYKKMAISTAAFRYKYLNQSNFISWFQFTIGKIKYKTWEKNCSKRGIYSLGEWSYAFKAIGLESESEKVWQGFKKDLINLKDFADKNNFKLYVLISPISVQLPYHEEMNIYNYDMKCATVDARGILIKELNNLSIDVIDPLPYMRQYVERFNNEGNHEDLFFKLDYGHLNELGNRIMGEELYRTLYYNFR